MCEKCADCPKDIEREGVDILTEFEVGDNYPAWEYRKVSPLRDAMVRIYEDMHGRSPKVCAIRAGLECGILTEKLPGADMVSIGPNMCCMHTSDERLEIKSVSAYLSWTYAFYAQSAHLMSIIA